MNPRFRLIAGVVFIGLVLPGPLRASGGPQSNLLVTVFEEDGTPATAHLYLYCRNKRRLAAGFDIKGSARLAVVPGTYRIYAAITRNNHGYIEHFASHEAIVELRPEDRNQIILTLRPQPETVSNISETTLEKLQLDPQIQRYMN